MECRNERVFILIIEHRQGRVHRRRTAKSAGDGQLRPELQALNELGEGISAAFNQLQVGGEGIDVKLALKNACAHIVHYVIGLRGPVTRYIDHPVAILMAEKDIVQRDRADTNVHLRRRRKLKQYTLPDKHVACTHDISSSVRIQCTMFSTGRRPLFHQRVEHRVIGVDPDGIRLVEVGRVALPTLGENSFSGAIAGPHFGTSPRL